jgi:hypothetical protein
MTNTCGPIQSPRNLVMNLEWNQDMYTSNLNRYFCRHTICSIVLTLRKISATVTASASLLLLCLLASGHQAWAQDWIKTGTGLGVEKIRPGREER